MTTNEKPSGIDQKDDSWLLLQHEKPHTRERSPQYNEDNESQHEMSGSSMGVGGDYVHVSEHTSGGGGYGCRPRSDNAESHATSTETGASANTVTIVNTTGLVPVIPGLPLNKQSLNISGRQPQCGYPWSIHGWLNDVNSVGDRSRHVECESTQASSAYFQTRKSKASTAASSISLEDNDWAPMALSLDLCEIGAWCHCFEAARRH